MVDSFSHSWKNGNLWVVPPPNLVLRVINKISREKSKCTLIIPEWKSAPFWPILFDSEFKSKIKSKFVFSSKLVKNRRGKHGIFGGRQSTFDMVALKI